MKLEFTHCTSFQTKKLTPAQAIEYEITTTTRSGHIEGVEDQLESLTRFLCKVIEELPEDTQKKLASDLFYWRLK